MAVKSKKEKEEPTSQCSAKHDAGLKCHWVIIKDDGSAILGYPHRSKDSAEAQLQFDNVSGFHIEHRFNQYQNRSDD